MPYSKTDYPDSIEGLPSDARDIWIGAYNSAYDNYDPKKTKNTREGYANAVAWSAVKKKYHQDKEGKWVLNEGGNMKTKEEIIVELLNEVGRRNAKADEERLLKIRALIDELLSDVANEAIKGSYEDMRDKLTSALRSARGKDNCIIATFADKIIYSSWGIENEKEKTFEIKYHIETVDDKEQIVFDGQPQPVELEIIVKSIAEAMDVDREKLARILSELGIEPTYDEKNSLDKALPDNLEKKTKGYAKNEASIHQINETITLKDYKILEEVKDEKGKTRSLKVKVEVAQIADVINENGRCYYKETLKEATENAQELAERGALTMYDTHPKTATVSDIIATVKKISFDETTGIVSLDEIEFIPTTTGKDCIEVIKAGVPLQVSQRGRGTSTKKNVNGRQVEFVDSLQVLGYDLLPPGDASVRHDQNKITILENKGGKIRMEITQEELDRQIDEAIKKSFEAHQGDLNEIATFKREREREKQINENKKFVEDLTKEEKTKFDRFTEAQQKKILDIDYSGTQEDVRKRLDEKMELVDAIIAQMKLENMGYKPASKGMVSIEVGNTPVPGAERIQKLNEAVSDELKKGEVYETKPPERVKKFIGEILQKFDKENWGRLLQEADTMGASNLPTTYEYSRVIIEQAFQRITSLALADLGTMDSSPHQVFIETYSEDPRAGINDLKVGQGGIMKKAALTLTPYNLYSETLKLRINLYEEALVAAISAGNYPLEAQAIASLVKDFQRRIDLYIYNLMIAKSDCYSTVKVTSFETLTPVGATNKWYSVNGGQNYLSNPTSSDARARRHNKWVKNEHIKVFDTAGNLGSTSIELVGTHASSVLQKVEVIDSSAPPKTLVFGFLQSDGSVRVKENDLTSAQADYYVLYPDGAIVIADSPVTPGLTAPYKAKYTYTKNARVWMLTPPSGVLFEDHLKELHQLTGQAKAQLIGSRFWTPNFLAGSVNTIDMISNSILFQQAGSNVANIIGQDGWIERFAGLTPTRSPIIPDTELIVGLTGAVLVRNHRPYRIEGPIFVSGVAEREYQGIETIAIDCAVPSRLATVGIGQ